MYKEGEPTSEYFDKHSKLTKEEYAERIKISTTLYVGNLSFYTPDHLLHEVFS